MIEADVTKHKAGLVLAISLCMITVALAAENDQRADKARAATNRVLHLDGKTSGVRVPDSPSLHYLSNAITLEVWFKAESFYPKNGAVNSLIRKNVAENAENFFLRFRTIEGQPWIELSPGIGLGVVRASYEFETNRWYHLAGVYDGKEATVFVNGKKVKSQPLGGSMSIDDSELFIGKGDPEWSSGEFFHGEIDEVRIWNVARSPENLRGAMNRTFIGKESGLIGYWTFDDGGAKDLSGHKNDGYLLGEAQIVEAPRPPAQQ